MSSLCFDIEAVDDCVVVVRMHSDFRMKDWPAYKAAYRNVYATFDHFVLVFDLRAVMIPPPDVVQLKLDLASEMKPHTTRQVLGVVVVTAYDMVAQLVTHMVKQGGQAAPFFITADAKTAANTAARMAHIIKRTPGCASEEVAMLTFGELPPGGYMVLVLLVFLRMQNHFLRLRARGS
jgi:hypothetical protein